MRSQRSAGSARIVRGSLRSIGRDGRPALRSPPGLMTSMGLRRVVSRRGHVLDHRMRFAAIDLMRLPLAVAGLLPVSLVPAQAAPHARLAVVTPITIAGAAGPSVSHPAGSLTTLSVAGPLGSTHGTYQCALTNGAGTCSLTAALTTGWGSWVTVSADLLLVVSAPAPGGT